MTGRMRFPVRVPASMEGVGYWNANRVSWKWLVDVCMMCCVSRFEVCKDREGKWVEST
jgi:hypothetical protein